MSDPRIVGYLDRAVAHELSAVQQYLAQARLTALWGMDDVSRRFRGEAQEELEHADRFITRMFHYGAAPRGSQLAPARLGRSLGELLARDRELEMEAVRLYDEAAVFCRRVGALDDAALFEAILEEELQHVREIDAWTAGQQPAGD